MVIGVCGVDMARRSVKRSRLQYGRGLAVRLEGHRRERGRGLRQRRLCPWRGQLALGRAAKGMPGAVGGGTVAAALVARLTTAATMAATTVAGLLFRALPRGHAIAELAFQFGTKIE